MSASASRIPVYNNNPWAWMYQMRQNNLLFHTDDDPASIICCDSSSPNYDKPLFTPHEVEYVRNVLRWIWKRWGDPIEYAHQVAVDFGDIASDT
jgi:hypothetical protein